MLREFQSKILHLNGAPALHNSVRMVLIPEEHPVLSPSATASRNPSEADSYCWNLSWRVHLSPCFQIWLCISAFQSSSGLFVYRNVVCEQVGHKTVRNATWALLQQLLGTPTPECCLPIIALFDYYCMVSVCSSAHPYLNKNWPWQHTTETRHCANYPIESTS